MFGWFFKKKGGMGTTTSSTASSSSSSSSSMPGISSDDYFAQKDKKDKKPKSSWFSREEEPRSRALLEPGEEEVDLKIDGKSKGFDATQFGRTLQKGFAQLYNDKLLSDVTLLLIEKPGDGSNDNEDESEESDDGEDETTKGKAKEKDGERVYAHRMVLATWSDIFRGMLSHEWKESQSNEITVELEPGDKEHFKCMLKYMYTGAVDFIDHSNVIPLLRLCDYYGVSGLKEVCGELLGAHVNEHNLFFLIDIMERFDCGTLNEKCGEFLAQNFDAMLKEDRGRMMGLRADTWVVMLKDDSLKIRSEEFLFEAVIEFAEQFVGDGEGSKEKVLSRLLPHIRYPLMSPKYLVEHVEDNNELQSLPGLREILYETFRLKSYPNAKPKHVCATPRKGSQGFDTTRCGTGITVSDNDQKMVMSSGGWNSIYCKVPFSAQRNYIEFKLETGNTYMIGVANGTVTTSGQYAGQASNGWTYYTAAGYLYTSGGQQSAYGGGQTLNQGDILGIKMDVSAGTMQCFKNGTALFTYSGMPTNSTTMFPIVGVSGAGTVSLVDGPYYK